MLLISITPVALFFSPDCIVHNVSHSVCVCVCVVIVSTNVDLLICPVTPVCVCAVVLSPIYWCV